MVVEASHTVVKAITVVLVLLATAAAVVFVVNLIKKRQKGTSSKEFSSSPKQFLRYNNEKVSLRDIVEGKVSDLSHFSPYHPNWFFNLSGLDANGKVIYSSSWHPDIILAPNIPKYEMIKKFQLSLGTHLRSDIPPDALQKVKYF